MFLSIVYNYCRFLSGTCTVFTTRSPLHWRDGLLPASGQGLLGRTDRVRHPVWENSVSRLHAILRVPASQGTPSAWDVSAFGTFVNGKKIGKVSEEIREGDQIVLGLQSQLSGTYSLRWRPVVLCCSQMTTAPLFSFKATAVSADISFLDIWDVTVTHLVVGELKTTQKVMCALPKVSALWMRAGWRA